MLDRTEPPKSFEEADERARRYGLAYELWTMSAETGRLPSELLGLPRGSEPDATRALAFDRTIRIAGKEWERVQMQQAQFMARRPDGPAPLGATLGGGA